MTRAQATEGTPVSNLESLHPEKAVEMYLESRSADVSEKTLMNHRYRLTRFVEWCDEMSIESMTEITGRKIHEYRFWRSEQVKAVTLVNELRTFQKFLEFCAAVDAVPPGMRERVLIPDLKAGEGVRDVHLEPDRAKEILDYLDRFEYAARSHVVLALLWHTGMRLGTLRAIDVDDYDRDVEVIDICNRPETGTRLKNGEPAERSINVSSYYCEVLDDYIKHNRPDVTDKFGRNPLIASNQGRLTASPIRRMVQKVTQPCHIGPCPHDKDPETCEWRERDHLSECPSSRSPHSIRRGSITHHLRNGTPQQIVQERADVSADILEEHYDERTEREKAAARREWLQDTIGDDLE